MGYTSGMSKMMPTLHYDVDLVDYFNLTQIQNPPWNPLFGAGGVYIWGSSTAKTMGQLMCCNHWFGTYYGAAIRSCIIYSYIPLLCAGMGRGGLL